MIALHLIGTWNLIPLPTHKYHVGCCWVYTIKIGEDGHANHLKARLVSKGYTQIYGSNYYDTFSPIAKMVYACLLLSMVVMSS